LDDQVLRSLERDFGDDQAALPCDRFDYSEEDAADLQKACLEQPPAFAEMDLGLEFEEFQAGMELHCEQALEQALDLLDAEDKHDLALKNLEVDLAGPDDDTPETMFCLREVEDALSRQSQEKLDLEASTLCTDAYDAAIEEYYKRLLDLVGTADQQTRCVSQFEVIVRKIRRAGHLFLLWVI